MLRLLFWFTSFCLLARTAWALGGEMAFFDTEPMTPDVTHRQDVCERYEMFRNGTVAMAYALEGLQLHVMVKNNDRHSFNYDYETGIDSDYPGIEAVLLDEMARRGKFTWRDTFGLCPLTTDEYNASWTDIMVWSMEAYDVSGGFWSESIERMKLGAAFTEGWYDSSYILIGKKQNHEMITRVNLWNWLKPYDLQVWMLTIFTILLSAGVYQVLEWYANERRDRSLWQWSLENFYLSAINFTQAYEYQPKTLASRIFGISMAIWALVMTATYTANLASLLIDPVARPPEPENIQEFVVFDYKICTQEFSSEDKYVRQTYPDATLIQKSTMLELYQALQTGECDVLVERVTRWGKSKDQKEFNPYCDLYWVGGDRVFKEVPGGFVIKADSGNLCTGFIHDVLNLHMRDMIEDGFLDGAWEREYKVTQDVDCDSYVPELFSQSDVNNTMTQSDNQSTRNLLGAGQQEVPRGSRQRYKTGHRDLKGKGGAAGAIAASAGGDEQRRLSVKQMIGTFFFHWMLMIVAVVCASINALRKKHEHRYQQAAKGVSKSTLETRNSSFKPDAEPTQEEEATKSATVPATMQLIELHKVVLEQRNQLESVQLQLQQSEKKRLEFEQQVLEELKGLKQMHQEQEDKSVQHDNCNGADGDEPEDGGSTYQAISWPGIRWPG